MKEKEELVKVTNKLNSITLLQAKVVLTITHENEILDFVLYNRALGSVISSNHTIYKLWSIDEKYKKKSWSSLQKWCYRFMHRNYLTLEEAPIFLKNFMWITWIECKNFYSITLNLEASMILNWMKL